MVETGLRIMSGLLPCMWLGVPPPIRSPLPAGWWLGLECGEEAAEPADSKWLSCPPPPPLPAADDEWRGEPRLELEPAEEEALDEAAEEEVA